MKSFPIRRTTKALGLLIAAAAAATFNVLGAAEINFDLRTPAARENTVRNLQARSQARRQAAHDLARRHGWPLRGQTPEGITYELMELVDGRPLYYRTLNVNAAISTAAAKVRNTAPYLADGAGVSIGIWDAGAVRQTHQEFGSRVVLMEEEVQYDDHATHVAGTIGAAGIDISARGMAPAVSIHSYDWHDDLSQATGSAAAGPGQAGKLYLSNHSYGYTLGWLFGNWSGTSAWHWHGDMEDGEDLNFGRYSSYARDWDSLAYSSPYYLPVWAAGNDRDNNAPSAGTKFYYYVSDATRPQRGWRSKEYDPESDPPDDGWKDGGYNTVAHQGVAKNTLTVGAVHDAVSGGQRDLTKAAMSGFSCWGPTDDGRIKPDVVGNGITLYSSLAGHNSQYGTYSGTSMAAPNIAGSLVLLIDYYRSLFPGEDMRSATLKGLLIHTADDLGNPGPDYRFGWGLMNTLAAAEKIRLHAEHGGAHYLVEHQLSGAEPEHIYQFTWNGRDPIRATLSWTDPPGNEKKDLNDTTPVLVNDLDLRLLAPNGATVYYPYVLDPADYTAVAATGDNVLDNVEQIFAVTPGSTGIYTIVVSHKGTLHDGEQNYSLLVSGQAPLGTAGLVINDLEQTYDGGEKVVAVMTDPPGLPVEVTYDGQADPPVAPGIYTVEARVTDPLYAGFADASLRVNPTITAEAADHGTISPEGVIVVPYGGDTNLVVTADQYWTIDYLLHDGWPENDARGRAVFTSSWQSVTAPHSVEAGFLALTATNNVPLWWLADHGWSNDWDTVAMEDWDGDGFATWQEYIADTNPTNPASFFPPLTMTNHASTVFLGINPTSSRRLYHVDVATNLAHDAWEPLFSLPGTSGPLTVEVPVAGYERAFFRSRVTLPPAE